MAASSAIPIGLAHLPAELIAVVVEQSSQETRHALCLVSRWMRQLAEPLLYQQVTIGRVAAFRSFYDTVTRDARRAGCVRMLALLYKYEELRGDVPSDEQVLEFLPNLRDLSIDSPCPNSPGWRKLLPRAIDPHASQPILARLKSCRLSFWDGTGEFWWAEDSLGLLYIPSLTRLELVNFHSGSGMPAKAFPQMAVLLEPLTRLDFWNCDVHETAVSSFLKARPTRALSILNPNPHYPHIEITPHGAQTYVDAYAQSSGTLEVLQLKRYFDRSEGPIHFRPLSALRALNMDPHTLFGRIPDRAGVEWLREIFPPSLEVLALECEDILRVLDVIATTLKLVLQAKPSILPNLRRIQFLRVDEKFQRVQPELQAALDRAEVKLTFEAGHFRGDWVESVMATLRR